MSQNKKILSVILSLALMLSLCSPLSNIGAAGTAASNATKATSAAEGFANYIKNTANQFIVIRHKQLGNSHYAYTNSVSDAMTLDQPTGGDNEYTWYPGAQMILLTYDENDVSKKTEEVLMKTSSGIIRDPDISADGKKVLYAYKANEQDDFHLYEMDLATRESTQLTFGQGISDTEGRYLPNGKILFSSTRIIQTVDCWKTNVSNLYTCDADGKNIVRFGYDQVHTTYPTVTSDGRVIYTRWDYNDRNQMFIQGVFQMFPDGTNQTELFGNNTSFPTTLLHTTEIPGQPGKYYSIASGHHTYQSGKLCVIDTTIDRNEYQGDTNYATTILDAEASGANLDPSGKELDRSKDVDKYGQLGWVYKFPVGISENELLVSMSKTPGGGANPGADQYINRNSPFNLYYTFVKEDGTCEYIEMYKYSSTYGGASQIAPIPKNPTNDFARPSMVNYAKNTGTYYLGNVYEGEAVKELVKPTYNEDGSIKTKGEVAQLRVVEIEYRSSAIGYTGQDGTYGGHGNPYTPVATGNGSWDVKCVLGVVDVEDDGSALFEVPSETPVYFQLLNKEGQVLQTMRSWSTLMPGETFSCVGCHENKNSVPPASSTVTMAMMKGVQKLKAEDWMKESSNYKGYDPYTDTGVGFSYMTEVQPILDKSCVSCHNNTDTAYGEVGYNNTDSANIFAEREAWEYTTSAPTANTQYASDYAPFGTLNTAPNEVNTVISADKVYLKKTFNITNFQMQKFDFQLSTICTGDAKIKINGKSVEYNAADVQIRREDNILKAGENVVEIELSKADGKMYFDASLTALDLNAKYWYATDYDVSGWKTSGTGGFGGDWGANKYNDKNLAIRNTFNLTQDQINNLNMSLDIKYDEDPYVYINGNLVWSTSGYKDDGYATIALTSAAMNYVKPGENQIAVTVTNNNGGKGLDLSLNVNGSEVIPKGAAGWKYYDGTPPKDGAKEDLLKVGSTWKYTITDSNSNPGNGWNTASFNDASWSTGNGPFGNNQVTSWVGENRIYLRNTFNIEDQATLDELKNSSLKLNIFFDEDPIVYVNGTNIFERENAAYNTGYEIFDVTDKLKDALQVGTNTIAVTAVNSTGGQAIDLGIKSIEKSDIPISFESTFLNNSTFMRQLPLSYLVLTGSPWSGEAQGTPNETDSLRQVNNRFTTWISSMSGSEIQPAKRYGSINSPIIDMVKANHANVNLTDVEIRTLEAWIDLCVPLCGSYDELGLWGGQATREYEEKQNKRHFYEDMNTASRDALANTVKDNGELTLSYIADGVILGSKTGVGTVQLNVKSELKAGHAVTIKLPEGQKYVAFRLDPRFEESIIYCPSGSFTYILPSYITQVFPRVLQPDENRRFRNLTMAARIPSEDELTESRNLALNPYDITSGNAVYPHVTTSSNYENNADFIGRNAIDGFTANEGHGSYPFHSWGPNQGNNEWFNIDFGRSVTVDKLVIHTRADFPHDVNYVSATLEFSDGTEKPVNLYKTTKGIELKLDEPIDTTYVKIKDLTTATSGWAGFAEVMVYGFENPDKEDIEVAVPATDVTLDKAEASVSCRKMLQLNATVMPAEASNKTVVWLTSDPNVAIVDANGKVTAIGMGQATITAMTVNGITANCIVTVLEKDEDDLLLHYDFASENITDNIVKDLSGYGFDGTLVQSEASIDLEGDAITLNNNGKTGSNAAGVNLPESLFSDMTTATLSFWIRPEYNTANHDTLFSMGKDINADCGAILYNFENRRTLRLATNSTKADVTANATRGLAENEWQLVTYVTDGGSAKLYLNGQELLESDRTDWNTLDLMTVQGAYLGRSICWGDAAFVGSIGDFKVYDKALTNAQILAEYANLAKDGYSFGAVKTDSYGYTHNTNNLKATAYQTAGANDFDFIRTTIPYNKVGNGTSYKIPLKENATEAYVILTLGGNYTVAVENGIAKTVDPFLGASGNAGEIDKVVLDVSDHIADGAVSITLSGNDARFYSAQICYDKNTYLGTQGEYGFRVNSSDEAAYVGEADKAEAADYKIADINPVSSNRRFTDNNAYFTWKLPLNLTAAKQVVAVYAEGRDLLLKACHGNNAWETIEGVVQGQTKWQVIDLSKYLQAAQADATAVQGKAYVELMMADSATGDGWGGCMMEIKVKSYYSITSQATNGTISITSDVTDDRAEREYTSTAASGNRAYWTFSKNAADLSKGNTTVLGYTPSADKIYLAEGEKVHVDVLPNANHSIIPGSFMGYRGDKAVYVPMRDGWRTDELQSTRHSIMLDSTTSGLEMRVVCKADDLLDAEDAIGLVGHSINPDKNGLRSIYRIRKTIIDGEEYITVRGEKKKIVSYGVLLATEKVVNANGGTKAFDMTNPSDKIKYYDFANKFANIRYDVADQYIDLALTLINIADANKSANICTRGYVEYENDDKTHSYAYTKISIKAYNDYA